MSEQIRWVEPAKPLRTSEECLQRLEALARKIAAYEGHDRSIPANALKLLRFVDEARAIVAMLPVEPERELTLEERVERLEKLVGDA